MTFSIWDPARRDYAYHEGPDTAGNPEATHLSGGHVGLSPYRAAWPLPAGTRPAGRGAVPRGVIATSSSFALAGLGDIPNGVKSLIVVGVGWYVCWWMLRDR